MKTLFGLWTICLIVFLCCVCIGLKKDDIMYKNYYEEEFPSDYHPSYPILPCPSDKPLMNIYEWCYSCDESEGIMLADAKDCALCPNRVLKGSTCVIPCPPDRPLMGNNGYCYACDDSQDMIYNIDENDCSLCPNRVQKGHACVLPCPSDKPLRDVYGNCHACDKTETSESSDKVVLIKGLFSFDSIDLLDKNDCSLCPNRKQIGEYTCTLSCPPDKPLMDSREICYACDEKKDLWLADANDCALCPNRIQKNENWCLHPCPPDKPLIDKNRQCHACDEKYVLELLDENDCTLCPDRKRKGDKCILPCPPDKPLMDEYGHCYTCDEKYPLELLDGNDCSLCPNRKQIGGWCDPAPANKYLSIKKDNGLPIKNIL